MLTLASRPSGAFLAVLLALLGGCGGAPAPAATPGGAEGARAQGGAVAAREPATAPEKGSASPEASRPEGEPQGAGQRSKVMPRGEPPDAPAAEAEAPGAALPAGTMVLHVGDSFAGALGLPLGRRLKAAGLKSVLEFETASYIPGWASNDKLRRLVNRYNPDLVLITLGANELEIVNPEQRIKNIRKIVAIVGDRPCVWVATPLWDGAKNGLFEIIRQNIAPCLYMDTNALITSMPRVSDGIHPTLPAREDWADVVVKWLVDHRKPSADKVWALSE